MVKKRALGRGLDALLGSEAEEGVVKEAVLESDKVRHHLTGREVVKWVVVPGRLVNLVTKEAA